MKIKNAYDAYWFIHDHPKMKVKSRGPVITKDEAESNKLIGHVITEFHKANGEILYQVEYQHLFNLAIDSLDVFYTKVDRTGKINDNKNKNVNTECWLELLVPYWPKAENADDGWVDSPVIMHLHDYKCDSGGKTHDRALINMARNIKKEYGDYDSREVDKSEENCDCFFHKTFPVVN